MVIMQNQNTEKKKKIHGTSVREMQLQHSHNTAFKLLTHGLHAFQFTKPAKIDSSGTPFISSTFNCGVVWFWKLC